jgi:hypothetical protein
LRPLIHSVEVDGSEIQTLIFDKLAPACEGEKLAHSVLGMITFSILLMKPDIDVDQLQDVVMSTSEYMVMQLEPIPEGEAN